MTEQDKQWIADQFQTIAKRAVEYIHGEMTSAIAASETRMLEELHRTEERIRDDFKKWAEPRRQRERSFDASLTSIRLDLDDVMDRLAKLEGK